MVLSRMSSFPNASKGQNSFERHQHCREAATTTLYRHECDIAGRPQRLVSSVHSQGDSHVGRQAVTSVQLVSFAGGQSLRARRNRNRTGCKPKTSYHINCRQPHCRGQQRDIRYCGQAHSTCRTANITKNSCGRAACISHEFLPKERMQKRAQAT